MASHNRFPFLGLALFTSVVLGAPPTHSVAACTEIKIALPGRVHLPGQAAYTKENKDYYNIGLADLRPTCITMPQSVQEVSQIVKILNKHESVPFAIKSGGHDPNPGHSSVKDGVLIALRYINGTEYDAAKGVAYVKPGGHWSDVITPLARQGQTVVSGRLGIVGIGGYLMQGGVSFLSAQHGLAADSILEYETVLANGSIVTINAKRNPELVRAMRGGGDQYGITTKFTLETYPIGQIWGGIRVYNGKQRTQVFDALADFIQNNHKDPKAAMIYTSGGGQVICQFFYNGTTPPAGAFGKFEALKPSVDYIRTMSYPDLLGMSNVLFNYFSARTSFRSITLPALPNKPGWYLELDSLWNEITAKRLKGKWTVQTTLAFQPFPHSIGKASESKGGNAMNLKGTDHERFVVEIAGIYFSAADDALIQSVSKEFTDTIFKQLEGLRANAKTKGESFPEYNPYFMNDAGLDQDVMGSYTNVAKFSKMQKSIDPKGFFAKRAGGFKYRA